MTGREALRHALELLETAKIDSPSLTAEVLLRHVLNMTRVQFFQQPGIVLTPEQETIFWGLINRHIKGEPVAYLTGHKEFYGLDFQVDNRVLIPRPETELLVEKVLETAGHKEPDSIADIGTGSGAIAVALACFMKTVKIFAVDISPEAIEVARLNSRKHGMDERIKFLIGDLASPLPEPVDVITANLPYVKTADLAEPSLHFEPRNALDGGPDGLDTVSRFIPQIDGKLKTGGTAFIEIGLGQGEAVPSIIERCYPEARIKIVKDYNKIDRVIIFSR